MNILIVNHYAGSPFYGMEYRPYYLARQWVQAGHKVALVAASYSHLRLHQPQCPGSITPEIINSIQYLWMRTPRYHRNNLKRVLNMLSFAGMLYAKPLPIMAPDVVIDSSTYPLTIYGSMRIARRHGAKLIFEVHDLWPLSPLELGGYSKWHPFIVVMRKAERYAYRNAYRVVSLLPNSKQYMIAHGMAPEKFIHIPNGIDISSWRLRNPLPEEHEGLLEKLRSNDKFIVGYVGAHGLANALQYLVDAAWILREQSKIHFILVGQGPEKESLRSFVKNNNLTNVSFLPPVHKTSIPKLLSYMDALFIGWRRRILYCFGISPNKLMDYMMSGKPVIHSVESSSDLVAQSECGISLPPEDAQAIADGVLRLFQMPSEQRTMMGRKGRDYVRAQHDYSVLATQFLEAL